MVYICHEIPLLLQKKLMYHLNEIQMAEFHAGIMVYNYNYAMKYPSQLENLFTIT